jgi:hypothetical protein
MLVCAIDNLPDLFAAEDPDDLVDSRSIDQQLIPFTLCQATGDNYRPHFALLLELDHLADDAQRFLAGRLDKPASIDDDDIRALGFGRKHVAVLGEFAEHALGIDKVFGAAKAHERESLLAACVCTHNDMLANNQEEGTCGDKSTVAVGSGLN